MSTVYVIGVDPGDSTGVCLFINAALIHVAQGDPDRMMRYVEMYLHRGQKELGDVTTVAIERYIQQARGARSHQPVAQQVVGMVQGLAVKYDASVVEQGPADAHAIMDTATMKRLGLHRTGEDVRYPDANDANMAIRHAILLMAKKHVSLFKQIVG